MGFANVSRNTMLDAFVSDRVSLHHGDPGAAGTNNEIDPATAYERKEVAWNAAGGTGGNGERRNNGAVVFNITGGDGNNSRVNHVGLWNNTVTPVFQGSAAVTEETFGANGTYWKKWKKVTRKLVA